MLDITHEAARPAVSVAPRRFEAGLSRRRHRTALKAAALPSGHGSRRNLPGAPSGQPKSQAGAENNRFKEDRP